MTKQLWGLCILSTLAAPAGIAQRVFYDSTRDAQAQAAVSAAKSVTSGSLYEVQLRNLDQLATQQLETVLRWQEIKMRASINSFETWSDVTRVLGRIETALAPYLDTAAEQSQVVGRAQEIQRRAEELKAQILAIQKATPAASGSAKEIFSHLGDAKESVDFAAGLAGKAPLNPAQVTALNEVAASLEQVQKLYSSVQGIIAGKAAVSVPVSSLRPNPLETELQFLRLEEEHWKSLGLIRARLALESGAIKTILDSARNYSGRYPAAERIEDTLDRFRLAGDRAQLEFALYAVFYAAAAAAQQETCAQLASLRKTIEERRYSIQQSAISAGAYEQTARAAAERLSIYWKSGIRPKDVAELLFYLSSAASLPAIAIR